MLEVRSCCHCCFNIMLEVYAVNKSCSFFQLTYGSGVLEEWWSSMSSLSKALSKRLTAVLFRLETWLVIIKKGVSNVSLVLKTDCVCNFGCVVQLQKRMCLGSLVFIMVHEVLHHSLEKLYWASAYLCGAACCLYIWSSTLTVWVIIIIVICDDEQISKIRGFAQRTYLLSLSPPLLLLGIISENGK